MTRMPLLLSPLLLLVAGTALADEKQCAHSAPKSLQLDYTGVRTVAFSIGGNKLKLDAAPGARATVAGRACASSANLLDQLVLSQEKRGDKLIVTAARTNTTSSWFGNNYAYMTLNATVPTDVTVEMSVGSGDTWITGTSSLHATVGSGDLEASRIRGAASVSVGSGDASFNDVGSLDVRSVGSGDVNASNVRGAVKVGSIGSGDFELDGAAGNVDIASIGSGDADLKRVTGHVTLGSVGSGDFSVDGVSGNLTVRSSGSGSVHHNGVKGTVDIPRKR